MQDEVKVTQADRELFIMLLGFDAVDDEKNFHLIRKGKFDHWGKMKAIARHRHQAERETRGRMEWRDIESAPKDGTWFTAYWPVQTFEDRVQTTRWLHDDYRFVDASDFMDDLQPIAWMPLPPAPEAGQ